MGFGSRRSKCFPRSNAPTPILILTYFCTRIAHRSGLVADSKRALLSHFAGLSIERCPFRNLPERTKGRWGEGFTAEDMVRCLWLVPRLVAAVEFLEWTPEQRLRHPRFVGLREDKDPNEVVRE